MSVGRAVVLSGGYAHPFAETSATLCDMLTDAGLRPEIHETTAGAMRAIPGARLLAVNALWWSMVQNEKYAPHRTAHAQHLQSAELAAIAAHVAEGGALLALHTATICWDTQPGWRNLMGGGWSWGRSHHPPLGPVDVSLTAAGKAMSPGAAHFTLVDEAYHALDPAADCTILANATAGGAPQPVVWTRHSGAGRVAVDALGHDRRSLEAPGHAALLRALIGWLVEGETHAQH